MNRIKSLGALIMIACLQVSCNEEKSYEFDEPYANHLSFLGLSEGVKSVSYEKQIYEISDGGYFPMTTNTNDIMATFEYPYSVNGLKYMGNFTSAMVFNYPFTANQYLINELIL